MKKYIFILLSIIIFVTGCGSTSNVSNSISNSLNEIIEKNNYVIVDVRTSHEYKTGHVKGAINIPYDEIDKLTKLDKTKKILVYCKSGGRSSVAYNILKDLGYDVMDLGAYDSIKLDKE